MKPAFFPTGAHLLVCTGPNCRSRGSDLLFRSAWAALERERLAYYAGGRVRLTESGCLGACHFGPTVACYFRRDAASAGPLHEAWYAGVDHRRFLALARAVNDGLAPPAEGRYDPDGSAAGGKGEGGPRE